MLNVMDHPEQQEITGLRYLFNEANNNIQNQIRCYQSRNIENNDAVLAELICLRQIGGLLDEIDLKHIQYCNEVQRLHIPFPCEFDIVLDNGYHVHIDIIGNYDTFVFTAITPNGTALQTTQHLEVLVYQIQEHETA